MKIDFARAAVKHFHGGATDDQQKNMIKAIMGRQWRHLSARCADEVLDAFAALPEDDKQAFGPVKFIAKDQEDLKARQERAPGEVPRAGTPKVHKTPPSLKSLVPLKPGSYVNRHPILQRYQAFYPVNSCWVACLLETRMGAFELCVLGFYFEDGLGSGRA